MAVAVVAAVAVPPGAARLGGLSCPAVESRAPVTGAPPSDPGPV